jgi:hypothetical protein
MTDTQQSITFLSLPLEIRNLIYKIVLVVPDGRAVCIDNHKWGKRIMATQTPMITGDFTAPSLPRGHGLLRVRKQVYREAIPTLYSQNTFHSYNPTNFQEWLQKIGPINITHIQCLSVFVDAYDTGFIADFNRQLDTIDIKNDGYYELLANLASRATGMCEMSIYFDCEGMHRGGGNDQDFMHGWLRFGDWKSSGPRVMVLESNGCAISGIRWTSRCILRTNSISGRSNVFSMLFHIQI